MYSNCLVEAIKAKLKDPNKKDDKICSRLIDARDLDKYENIICWREASVEANYLLDLDNSFEFKNEDSLII